MPRFWIEQYASPRHRPYDHLLGCLYLLPGMAFDSVPSDADVGINAGIEVRHAR